MSEFNNKLRLNDARNKDAGQLRQMGKSAKTLAASATPWGALSLISQMNIFTDWLYALAMAAALVKDVLDYVGIGSLPALGTIITICVSLFIGLMLLLAGSGGKRKLVKGGMKRFLVLIFGTAIEAFFFGLNFFPIETLTVIIIYLLVLAERKQEAQERKKLEASQEQYA